MPVLPVPPSEQTPLMFAVESSLKYAYE